MKKHIAEDFNQAESNKPLKLRKGSIIMTETGSEPSKRGRPPGSMNRNHSNYVTASSGDVDDAFSKFDLDNAESSSLMKRRRRKELKISVDGSASGGGAVQMNMGPPTDTPHRVFKFKGSQFARDNIDGHLESPLSLEKHVMFHDFMQPLQSDTPGRLMSLDPPISKVSTSLSNDSLKFDFDEIVQHFPSPSAGQPGSSPHRWSGGSTGFSGGSGSIFTFPDGGYSRNALEAAVDAVDATISNDNSGRLLPKKRGRPPTSSSSASAASSSASVAANTSSAARNSASNASNFHSLETIKTLHSSMTDHELFRYSLNSLHSSRSSGSSAGLCLDAFDLPSPLSTNSKSGPLDNISPGIIDEGDIDFGATSPGRAAQLSPRVMDDVEAAALLGMTLLDTPRNDVPKNTEGFPSTRSSRKKDENKEEKADYGNEQCELVDE